MPSKHNDCIPDVSSGPYLVTAVRGLFLGGSSWPLGDPTGGSCLPTGRCIGGLSKSFAPPAFHFSQPASRCMTCLARCAYAAPLSVTFSKASSTSAFTSSSSVSCTVHDSASGVILTADDCDREKLRLIFCRLQGYLICQMFSMQRILIACTAEPIQSLQFVCVPTAH